MGLFAAMRPNAGLQINASMLEPPRAAITVGVDDISGLVGRWMTATTAMQLPAFARGINLICGVAAGFPLRSYGDRTPRLLLGGRMSAHATDHDLVAATVQDMICTGRAAWKFDQTRSTVRRLNPEVVQAETTEGFADPDRWTIAGKHDPDVLVFDHGVGVLEHGWPTIRTGLAIEQAAANIAASPIPASILHSTGFDLSRDDATDLLNEWESARRRRATAYLPGSVELKTVGMTSADMQLVEARRHVAEECARLLNLDGIWVGVETGGTSLLYQNRQDLNTALLDLTVMPLLRTLEQSLSAFLSDTGSRQILRFDTTAFTRANLADRVAALTALVGSGILTTAEARNLEPLIHEGEIPQ